jgi:antitoxin YefM
MSAITASDARKNLFPLIERVNTDRTPVEITSRHGNAVLLAKPEYDALVETAHLLRAPANAERLLESVDQSRRDDQSGHVLGK